MGIDVVYIAANLAMQESDETTLIDGVPTLIIEILSPSDTIEAIEEKIDIDQKAGVPLIWIIDPHDRTITIYRLDAEPELVNIRQELSGEPFLPGFRSSCPDLCLSFPRKDHYSRHNRHITRYRPSFPNISSFKSSVASIRIASAISAVAIPHAFAAPP